jgi:hypothetical protein
MRKIFLLVAIVAAFAAWSVASASATVHPLVCSENSAAPAWTPAITQDPPGITPGGVDQGRAATAQPVLVAADAAFKPPGC